MRTKYLAFAVVATMFAACSNENIPVDDAKDTPITIESAGVAELTTRAIKNKYLSGDGTTLGFYVSAADDRYKADHERYDYKTSRWVLNTTETNDAIQMLYNGSFEWIVYSPYCITTSDTPDYLYDNATFSVPTDGNYGDVDEVTGSQYDLLWGKGTSSSSDVTAFVNHALTLFTVNIAALGTEIESGVTITDVTIGGTIPTGTLNLTSAASAGSVVTIPSTGAAEMADIKAMEVETAEGMVATYEALIIPQTVAPKLTVTLSNDKAFSTTLDSQEFLFSHQYNITLQVGQDKVTLGGINASSWTSVDGGQLETE